MRVLGCIKAKIEVGSCKTFVQRLQVLDSEEPTVLLGRQLMQRLGTVSFDFNQGRVKIGDVWEIYEATVHGATPLARAQMVKQDEELEDSSKTARSSLVNTELPDSEYNRLDIVTQRFEHVFARDGKKPPRTKLHTQHAIITDDALPQRSRPRRVPPKWEEEINRQLEEMLKADPPIARPSSSPWRTIGA